MSEMSPENGNRHSSARAALLHVSACSLRLSSIKLAHLVNDLGNAYYSTKFAISQSSFMLGENLFESADSFLINLLFA